LANRRRFIFHHLPRTGGLAVTGAAGAAGLRWERAWRGTEILEQFMEENGWRDWLTSHHLFANYVREPGDVYFSWIRDPVDMFFSGFRYWRAFPVRGDEFRPEMVDFMRGVRSYRDPREYVDRVLELRPAHVFPTGLLAGEDWGRFDFVGRTDRMADSIAAFNEAYGTALTPTRTNATAAVRTEYRRPELEELFAADLEAFRRICAPTWRDYGAVLTPARARD
jgi:hypothetical protein